VGTRVTFTGSPRHHHYMGSDPGTIDLWLPGETRDLSPEVASKLLDDFGGLFEVVKPKATKASKAKAAPRAIQAPGNKSPATKTKAKTKKPKTTRRKAGG